jgi:hypothetical protein
VTGRDAIDPGSDPHNAHQMARADVFADDRERSDWSVAPNRRHAQRIRRRPKAKGIGAKRLASLCTLLPTTKLALHQTSSIRSRR